MNDRYRGAPRIYQLTERTKEIDLPCLCTSFSTFLCFHLFSHCFPIVLTLFLLICSAPPKTTMATTCFRTKHVPEINISHTGFFMSKCLNVVSSLTLFSLICLMPKKHYGDRALSDNTCAGNKTSHGIFLGV